MMLVKREVFRTMMKKFPERKYQSDQIINGKSFSSDNCYDLFAAGPLRIQVQERNDIYRKIITSLKIMARMWWRYLGRYSDAFNTLWK
jgi:hypothetical protein